MRVRAVVPIPPRMEAPQGLTIHPLYPGLHAASRQMACPLM